MNSAEVKLLSCWEEFREENPDLSKEIKKQIQLIYTLGVNERGEKNQARKELIKLQGVLEEHSECLRCLGINPEDLHDVALWATAMGLIFLVKEERAL